MVTSLLELNHSSRRINLYLNQIASRLAKHIVRHGMVWHGMAWCGMAWFGVTWHGVVLCGMVWHVVAWDIVQQHMTSL